MVESLVQMISNLGKSVLKIGSYYQTTSLADAAKITRVEPILVVSKDMINSEYLPDVSQTLLSIFSGYFLQAFNLTSSVNSVRVIKTLDRLNPDRDSSGYLLANETLADYKTQAASFYEHKLPLAKLRISKEDDALFETLLAKDSLDEKVEASGTIRSDAPADVNKILNETSNAAVGKIINVSFKAKDGDKDVSLDIPIAVRLVPVLLSNLAIVKILGMKTEENTLVERYHAWRAGRIGFIRDLIFCQDLIDEAKKVMMEDEDGTYTEIIRRANSTKKYGLLTANPSLVSASNLFIISSDVAKELETKLGGRLSNPKIINKAFENTYAMIIVVVDTEWERATFYTRNISTSANYSLKELKAANKNKGIDVMDVLKSFSHGNSPSF